MNEPNFHSVDQRHKFISLCECFPMKARELADSINKTIPELRELICTDVYYLDDGCQLVEIPFNKACYDLKKAVKDSIGEDKLKKLDKVLSMKLW